MYQKRLLRARVLEALELRVKQFRAREDTHPFRVPHAPLHLGALIDDALAGDGGTIGEDELRSPVGRESRAHRLVARPR